MKLRWSPDETVEVLEDDDTLSAVYSLQIPLEAQGYGHHWHGLYELEFKGWDPVNVCSYCGRFDTEPRVVLGRTPLDCIEAAVELGWMTRMEP